MNTPGILHKEHTLEGKFGDHDCVILDGVPLTPTESQKVRNHSPDGFNWGYGGSGPAQLALALMLKLTGSYDSYQDFKWRFVAALPARDFKVVFSIQRGVIRTL